MPLPSTYICGQDLENIIMRTVEELARLVRERGEAEQRRMSAPCKGAHVSSGAEVVAAIERGIALIGHQRVPTELRELTPDSVAWYRDETERAERLARYASLASSRDVVNELLADKGIAASEGRLEESTGFGALAALANREGRDPCGADHVKLILNRGPFDRGTHPYECPQCGVTGEYTAPYYPAPLIDDAAAATIAGSGAGEPVSADVILAISAVRESADATELQRFARLWQHPDVDVDEVIRIAALMREDETQPIAWGSRGIVVPAVAATESA